MSHVCRLCKNKKELSETILLICKHRFCWTCIEKYLKDDLKNKNKCPQKSCIRIMKDHEVRQILSEEDIERYNDICLHKIKDGYECLLPGCGRILLLSGENIQFECAQCTVFNCVNCRLAHKGMLCHETVSVTGQTMQQVCQIEMDRANSILQNKLAQMKRADILKQEQHILITNTCIFTCELCTTDIGKNKGITLRGCFHQMCRSCLSDHVKNSSLMPVPCPFTGCKGTLEDRECREILTELDKSIYETKSIKWASKFLDRADHCRQFNCDYMCDLEKTVTSWTCPKCSSVNCMACNFIHPDQTCDEYQSSKVLSKDEKNIEDQIKQKKLMRCPDCKNILKKTGGCNWIPCPNCGVELCWVNQMHRWGPKGPNDTSGGCMCGVNGKMCHPTCGGCIADIGRRHRRYTEVSRGFFDNIFAMGRTYSFNDAMDGPRAQNPSQSIFAPLARTPGTARQEPRRFINRGVRPLGRSRPSDADNNG